MRPNYTPQTVTPQEAERLNTKCTCGRVKLAKQKACWLCTLRTSEKSCHKCGAEPMPGKTLCRECAQKAVLADAADHRRYVLLAWPSARR
jgi:predicted amidophosphoribosyltransferase